MENKAKEHPLETQQKRIWIIPKYENGDITGIYTNAPDETDIRLHLFEAESDDEDYDTVCAFRACLDGFTNSGKLRQLEPEEIEWMLLDAATCLCTIRYPDWEYQFAQVCELPDGGYGIASTGTEFIHLEDQYSREERIAYIELCGKSFTDSPYDPHLENVHVAACVFQAELERYILPDLKFERVEDAKVYLAQNIVDCLVDPSIQYAGEPSQWIPRCVDIDKMLPELDKETLVRVAMAYIIHVANCACFSPDKTSFRLEEYLIHNTPDALCRIIGPQREKSPRLRKDLAELSKETICQWLLRYNHYLKLHFYKCGSILGTVDADEHLKSFLLHRSKRK